VEINREHDVTGKLGSAQMRAVLPLSTAFGCPTNCFHVDIKRSGTSGMTAPPLPCRLAAVQGAGLLREGYQRAAVRGQARITFYLIRKIL
jgi:hypothetical protein